MMEILIRLEQCEMDHEIRNLHMMKHDIWLHLDLQRHDIRSHDGKMIVERIIQMKHKYGTGLRKKMVRYLSMLNGLLISIRLSMT